MITRPSFKYVDLAQKLTRQIAATRLRVGDRIPTEDELVRQHRLSRITVRRALALLEADGLIRRKRKSGTFLNRALDPVRERHRIGGAVAVILSPMRESAVDESNVSENHALATTLRALEQSLSDRGFAVQIISVGRDEAQDRARLLRLVEQGDIEGICVHGSGIEQYRALLGSIPLVTSCTFVPGSSPWVGESTEELIYTCVRHLVQRGHQRIALVCGPWLDSRAMAHFAAGQKRALDEAGVAFDRRMLCQAYAGEDLSELAAQILSTQPRPTAIVAQDWRVTRGILSAAQRLELEIPRDLSLMACGENVQYLSTTTPISAYVPDNAKVGQEIARVLIDLIDGHPAPTEPIFVPGRLIERDSVAPPL